MVSEEFDVIISQNGTEKLVASFLPIGTVLKNLCASPRLQNRRDYQIKAKKISRKLSVEIKLYECFDMKLL